MFLKFLNALLFCLSFLSCNTGKLTIVTDIPSDLKEVSGNDITSNSNLLWVIEDSGNRNHVYGLNNKGSIIKDISISNTDNIDWEDLTADTLGNLYIGDFGNNDKNRQQFTILKITDPQNSKAETTAENISFKLPKGQKSKDFEAFFLYGNYFYLFSKEDKKCILIKVPNKIGHHRAELVTAFNLKGKGNHITSADISDDGKTVILLNHEKVWKLSNFTGDNFFNGSIEALSFEHSSQKEGVCFKSNQIILITDESDDDLGSNVYRFKIN